MRLGLGEVQEHLVERGAAQGEVVDLDRLGIERAHDRGERRRAVGDLDGDRAGVGIDGWLGAGRPADDERGIREPGAVGRHDRDAVAADAALELAGRALGDHAAVVHHRDAIGELVGLIEVLRGEQHRRAGGGDLADRLPDRGASAWVESGGRLVEEQDGRREHEARGDVEAAAHPAGEARDRAVRGIRERERREQVVGASPGPRLRHAAEAGEQHQVLPRRERLVDRVELADEADALAHGRRVATHVDPVDARRALVEVGQRGEALHGRRLARAVRSEQAVHGAAFDGEVESVERHRRPVALAESVGEEGRGWGGGRSRSHRSLSAYAIRCYSMTVHHTENVG